MPLLSSDTSYARHAKGLLSLVKNLRASGAQADLDLPRIAVIGNQSAGKSSLVEAISGITVPRDAGTCTRCPMECRMSSSSETWSCRVSIRWEFDSEGKRRDKVEEVDFGGPINDKGDVELMIRRAQTAVLHPKQPSSKFLHMSFQELADLPGGGAKVHALPFSNNTVCVDLTGPDLTDLSFIDLPGIIQNAEPRIVQFVEDLVLSHIKGNCLILVTLPMSDDIDNQKAARLACDVDRSGRRTIGVLTKPDTLPPGSTKLRELWLELLEGRSANNQLMHGYFCTRQPDDEERATGITAPQARVAEAQFFASNSPWNKSSQQYRFGTQNLVDTLSKLLIQRIDETLPSLRAEVTTQLTRCAIELEKLPEAISTDPSSYVLHLVTEFCRMVHAHIHGGLSTASLVQKNQQKYAKFKRGIRDTAPRFIPYYSENDMIDDAEDPALVEDDVDEDEEDNEPSPVNVTCMSLKDVRQFIRGSLTRELPNNVPYNAKVKLIKNFQETWENQCRTCFEQVYKECEITIMTLLHERFGQYENLEGSARVAVQGLLQSQKEVALTYILSLLKLETTPYTQNYHYLSDKTAVTLAKYKDVQANNASSRKGGKRPSLHEFGLNKKQKLSPVHQGSSSGQEVGNSANQQPPATSSIQSIRAGKILKKKGKGYGDRPVSPQAVRLDNANTMPAAVYGSTFGMGQSAFGTGQTDARKAVPEDPELTAEAEAADRENVTREALALLAKLGYTGLTAEDLPKLSPPDEFEEELHVMAEVRAYFQVSYKRIIDYIPLAIDHQFLYGLNEILQKSLVDKLGLGMSDAATRCMVYLAEDPIIVAKRKELSSKKARLESVQLALENFGL